MQPLFKVAQLLHHLGAPVQVAAKDKHSHKYEAYDDNDDYCPWPSLCPRLIFIGCKDWVRGLAFKVGKLPWPSQVDQI
jgi:hypothetical protein